MGGFLGGLFESKSASSEGASVSRAVSQSPSRYGTYASGGIWDIDKAVNDALEKDYLVYRCIDAIATNQASIPLLHRRGDARTGTLVQSPRLMTLLNVRPNSYETAAQFRYRLTAQALLSRKGVFIECLPNVQNPESLHLIPPQSVEPIPGVAKYDLQGNFISQNFVDGYRVRSADMTETILTPDKVLWVKLKPHPIDPYQQMTPLVAAGIPIETDILARMFNRNFLQNDGRPGLLVSVRGQMAPDDMAEIKRRFGGGPAQAGVTTVIEAEGLDIADLGATPRDAQWVESLAVTKNDILLAFGVPESVLGNASGRCVDDKTEALTKRGWVNGHDLTTDDVILSCDPATGGLVWSQIHEVYRNENYSGEMYRLKHSTADFLVTPGHNWLTTDGDLVKVENLNTKSRLVLMGDAEQGSDHMIHDDAFAELVGWTVTEGHYSRYKSGNEANYVRIRQNSGYKADQIEACLIDLDAEYGVHESDGKKLFNVRGTVAKELRQAAPDKVPSIEFINELTQQQRVYLFDAMIDGDGCRQKSTRSITFAQKDKRVTEAFVYLSTLLGYSTSMREREYDYTYNGVTTRKSDWIAIVRHGKVLTTQRDTIKQEAYDGFVWCPRTDYGTFVARREGRVFVTGNTFDNADAEYEMFWTHTMKPHCEALAAAFDPFTGSNNDNEVIAYDYSTVDVLQRQERRRQETVIAQYQAGVITWDEMRALLNLEQWPDSLAARIVLLPGGFVAAKTPDDQEKIMELANIAKFAPAAPAGAPGGPAELPPFAALANGGAQLQGPDNSRIRTLLAARALELAGKDALTAEQIETPEDDAAPFGGKALVVEPVVHPYAEQLKSAEYILTGVLFGVSTRQEDVICDRLGHAKSRKGTRHWEGTEEKAYRPLDPFYAIEVDRWVREVTENFERVLMPTLRREAKRVVKDIMDNGLTAPSPEDQKMIRQAALSGAMNMVDQAVRNQSNRIADLIRKMDDDGAPLDDIKSEVRKLVSTRGKWHKQLSAHAAIAAIEGTKHGIYATVPGAKKTWNTEEDERVRDSHWWLDGKTISVRSKFMVGESLMDFPHDPTGPVEEVANCRCWTSFSV